MLDLAKHIIQTKMDHFDISKFEDRYENALIEMIRAKQAGRPVEASRPQAPTHVVNLMEALRKSIAAEIGGRSPRPGGEKEQGQDRQKGQRKLPPMPAAIAQCRRNKGRTEANGARER